MKYENGWTFDDVIFTSEDIEDYLGFVYLITNKLSGQMYVGRKYFHSTRRKKVKDKKRRKIVIKESDWKTYYGSSENLKEDVCGLGKENFKREIISIHKTKGDTNYSEVKEQFKRNVLEEKDANGEKLYYNANIMSRYFFLTDDGKRKISEKLSGKKKSPEHCKHLSEAHMGQIPWNKNLKTGVGGNKGPMSEEIKEKISESLKGNTNCKGRILSLETKNKLSESLKVNSSFVKDNPRSSDKWISNVIFKDNITKEINDFKKYCSDNNINYVNLKAWSKKHLEDDMLHPKYSMKILSIRKE